MKTSSLVIKEPMKFIASIELNLYDHLWKQQVGHCSISDFHITSYYCTISYFTLSVYKSDMLKICGISLFLLLIAYNIMYYQEVITFYGYVFSQFFSINYGFCMIIIITKIISDCIIREY